MREIEFICESNSTVLNLLSENGVSNRLIRKLKNTKNGITRNGEAIRTIDNIKKGDKIIIKLYDEKSLEQNKSLNVSVLYEDEDIIIFDKPYNMPVHPSLKHHSDSLGNYFAYLYPNLSFRPINRLDRDTTGACVVAKNAFSARALQKSLIKTYYAIACGVINDGGVIEKPIAREDNSIIKRVVSDSGEYAKTSYEVISHNDKYTYLKINLDTGRTHQIRVHFSYIGFPLAGDDMYGGITSDINRQALHCGNVEFLHPITKKTIKVTSSLPDDIKKLI